MTDNPYRKVHHTQPSKDELLTDGEGAPREPSPRPESEGGRAEGFPDPRQGGSP
jgi:hypothetical protein